MLEHETDIFQLKADFVAFPSGLISILVHIPVVDSSTKLKLYKFIGTPTFNNKYQFLVDSKEKYLAVNQDSTLYTVLDDLEKCETMRDVNICNDINILHKAGSSQIAYSIYLPTIWRVQQKHVNIEFKTLKTLPCD